MNGLWCFVICRCWERNINMGFWWIIRSPILFAYLVRDTDLHLISSNLIQYVWNQKNRSFAWQRNHSSCFYAEDLLCVCCICMCWSIEIQAVSNIILHSHTHTHTVSCWYYLRTRSSSASGSWTLYELGVSLSVCSVCSSTHIKMLRGLHKVMKTITTEMLVLHNINDSFHESCLYCSSTMFWLNKKVHQKQPRAPAETKTFLKQYVNLMTVCDIR